MESQTASSLSNAASLRTEQLQIHACGRLTAGNFFRSQNNKYHNWSDKHFRERYISCNEVLIESAEKLSAVNSINTPDITEGTPARSAVRELYFG